VTAAKPKTADYPFTTLHPHLGVVNLGPTERFVLADLPGLIEGASEGIGLGHRFLGHIERCAAILHLVDASTKDPAHDYATIRQELINYDGGLETKPEIVVLTKCDALSAEKIAQATKAVTGICGQNPLPIFSVASQGLRPVLSAVYQHVAKRRIREDKDREARNKALAIKEHATEKVHIKETDGWHP